MRILRKLHGISFLILSALIAHPAPPKAEPPAEKPVGTPKANDRQPTGEESRQVPTSSEIEDLKASAEKGDADAHVLKDSSRLIANLSEALYRGSGEGVDEFSVNLHLVDKSLTISAIQYDFAGSSARGARLEFDEPFGNIESDSISFQFPVLVAMRPTEAKSIPDELQVELDPQIVYYSAVIKDGDHPDQLKCELKRIDALDQQFSSQKYELSAEKINFKGPDAKMQKKYTLKLTRIDQRKTNSSPANGPSS